MKGPNRKQRAERERLRLVGRQRKGPVCWALYTYVNANGRTRNTVDCWKHGIVAVAYGPPARRSDCVVARSQARLRSERFAERGLFVAPSPHGTQALQQV